MTNFSPNQLIIHNFTQTVGGNLYYVENNKNRWVVEINNIFLDHNGKVENNLDLIKLPNNIIKELEASNINLTENQLDQTGFLRYEFILAEDEQMNNFYSEVNKIYPYKLVKYLREFTAFLIETPDNQLQVFNILQKNKCILPIQDVINIYSTLAEAQLSPQVYKTGMIGNFYGFVINKYYNTSLHKIMNDHSISKKEKDKIYEKAMTVTYRIQNEFDLYNLDAHDENYLYDYETQNIYMIDFRDTTLDSRRKFNGEIHIIKF